MNDMRVITNISHQPIDQETRPSQTNTKALSFIEKHAVSLLLLESHMIFDVSMLRKKAQD